MKKEVELIMEKPGRCNIGNLEYRAKDIFLIFFKVYSTGVLHIKRNFSSNEL